MSSRFFGLLLMILHTGYAGAQITTIQRRMKDSTIDVIYTGLSNIVCIKNIEDGYKVEFNGEEVKPCYQEDSATSPYRDFALSTKKEGRCNLQIFKGNKTVYQRTFLAIKTPSFQFEKLGIVKDSIATVNEILAAPYIFCVFPNFLFKYNYAPHTIYYEITLHHGAHIFTKTKASTKGKDLDGVRFDEDIIDIIKTMKKDDKITIEDIKTCGVDFCAVVLPPIRITIK